LGNKSNDNYTEENDTEEYISFTNFEKLSTDDDKVANYNLVCGIKFEKNYLNGLIEQTVLYELNEGNIFNFDDVVEIKKITPNEVVLRISDFVQLSKIAKVETEEPNKIDVTLKLNELVTGCSMKFVPSTVYYKIKVLYIRKKEISNSNLTK
jgi:hypothetical protein